MKRLPQQPGEWIDRSRPISFTFEGRRYDAYAGDVVTSALWAGGERVLGRSFKYHRPRGVLSLANHDCNVVVQNGGEPNVRADVTAVEAGMRLTAVNTFGGLRKDKARILGRFSAFLPVGFYYKAFHTRKLFPLWERMFRMVTGLGRVDFETPHRRTPKQYDFCDVLVIGAGPSGLSAALAAAEAGAKVVVVDENAGAGGSGLYQIGGDSQRAVITRQLLDGVRTHAGISLRTATCAAGYYADCWVPLVDAEKLTKMRASSVVMATGAFEQPAVFHNNDLPGVMLASAAQRLIRRYAVQPMQRAVVLAANSDAYRAAIDLAGSGVTVAAIVDLRKEVPHSPIVREALALGIECIAGACVYEAAGYPGSGELVGVNVCAFDANGQPKRTEARRIDCDGLAVSVGWAPAANLLYQAGTRMRYDKSVEQFVPDVLPQGVFACGRVNGVYALQGKIDDGRRAGIAAAVHAGFGVAGEVPVPTESECPSHPWPVVDHPAGKNFVDFDEDLQLKDFANAVQEGFDNIELIKRYSTNGMGPSQGKHSNMNGLRILARLTGKEPQQVGTTTARPFFHPVPMSHLAGRGFTPERKTPLHSRHERLGAIWMAAGVWQRPEYYAVAGKTRVECIHGEVQAVRNAAGLIDVGTLGKLDVVGPQAAEFLERVYGGKYAGMKVGTTRYGIMCDESGVMTDEGVIARLGEQHFYFTTTTSNAANIYRELSRLNTIWKLDCGLINLTGAHAAVNLAGPASRRILERVCDIDLSSDGFPYLAVRQAAVAGVPARLMRVGFVGEWAYEIHVPAEYAATLWDALMAGGAAHGIRAFGVEAQRLMRLEKGHLIVSQDTDGLTTPFDVGMAWAVRMDKPFFIGQRSLKVIAKQPRTKSLVGFTLPVGYSGTAPQECHLIIERGDIAGRITSIAFSPNLGCYIGLAFVQPEMAEEGRSFAIRLSDGSMVTATVAKLPFYDPQDLRQKGAA